MRMDTDLEGGKTRVAVPEGTQIRRTITQRVADLKPGMRLVVRGTAGADGMLAASSINFELPPL